MGEEITMTGLTIDIDPSRSVWMAKWPKEDRSFALCFTNDGVLTKLRLSGEAIEAVEKLYRELTAATSGMWMVKVAEIIEEKIVERQLDGGEVPPAIL